MDQEFVEVVLPAVGDVDALKVKVLTKRSNFFMELCPKVLNYIVAAVRAAPSDAEGDAGPHIDDRMPKYMSYDAVRKAYRFRSKGLSKLFLESHCEDALGTANQFLASLDRSGAQ